MMGENDEDWDYLIQAPIGADGRSRMKIAAYKMEDPYTFGRFLGDIVRHGALAYATTWSVDENEAIERICEDLSDKLRLQDTPIKCEQPGSLD
ncbi:MAG: DUF5076 domain-containing protein [Erythrobacteraceae bacterium]|jgi:hypothetical protein